VAARGVGYAVGVLRVSRTTIPVLSVGNLTVGGTGKTPLVIHLAKELGARGETVAVLARGYGAERDGDLNDEMRQIQADVPDALLFPGRDRVARAADAVAAGATVIVLDDGFQHRRLGRDVDIVAIDATEPWGAPPHKMLPRGLLREPPAAVRRADVVVLSRIELVARKRLEEIERELADFGFTGPVLRMRLHPSRLETLAVADWAEAPGEAPEELAGKGVIAACGIGNPKAFGATLASLGARMSQLHGLPDHHAYSLEDVEHLEKLASDRAVDTIVVTSKDAVKLRALLDGPRRVTWLALGVEARLEPASAVDDLLQRAKPPDGQGHP
jgi:tetraacyldisaccharide 4'-kinase